MPYFYFKAWVMAEYPILYGFFERQEIVFHNIKAGFIRINLKKG
jgi:hypothetical protein